MSSTVATVLDIYSRREAASAAYLGVLGAQHAAESHLTSLYDADADDEGVSHAQDAVDAKAAAVREAVTVIDEIDGELAPYRHGDESADAVLCRVLGRGAPAYRVTVPVAGAVSYWTGADLTQDKVAAPSWDVDEAFAQQAAANNRLFHDLSKEDRLAIGLELVDPRG